MRFSVLSSGSAANVTFVEAAGKRVLIDCGLSAKQTCVRLMQLGIDPESIDAIIVTHEHSDHIAGIPVLSRRMKLPVYANASTSGHISDPYGRERFDTGVTFEIGDMRIHPFSIVHDAADPVGFAIEAEGLKLVYATDMGRVTPLVRDHVCGAHALILESNHDHDMLMSSAYPWDLKQRIASNYGHLSNDNSAALLAEVMHSQLLHVVLAHLSENCNTPDLALEVARRFLPESRQFTLECGSIARSTALHRVGEEARIAATT